MRVLAASLVIVSGLSTGVADAAQPGDPPLETALRLVTNGKPAAVIYHANGRYDVIVTGSAGHTQHVFGGPRIRRCAIALSPIPHRGMPASHFAKNRGTTSG